MLFENRVFYPLDYDYLEGRSSCVFLSHSCIHQDRLGWAAITSHCEPSESYSDNGWFLAHTMHPSGSSWVLAPCPCHSGIQATSWSFKSQVTSSHIPLLRGWSHGHFLQKDLGSKDFSWVAMCQLKLFLQKSRKALGDNWKSAISLRYFKLNISKSKLLILFASSPTTVPPPIPSWINAVLFTQPPK